MPFSSIRIPAIMPPQALLCVMVLLVVAAFPVAAALPQGCAGTTSLQQPPRAYAPRLWNARKSASKGTHTARLRPLPRCQCRLPQ